MVDIQYIQNNIKEGWKLNPNEKVVNAIIKGINRCDTKCPCSGYRLNDKCCCNLYVKIS